MPGQEYHQPSVGNAEEKAQVEDVVLDALVCAPGGVAGASKEEERRLVRKLDRRIMPMLAVMYLFAGELLHTDIFTAETKYGSSSGQDQFGQRATARASTGHPPW